jgi:hypothetical protein
MAYYNDPNWSSPCSFKRFTNFAQERIMDFKGS